MRKQNSCLIKGNEKKMKFDLFEKIMTIICIISICMFVISMIILSADMIKSIFL